MTPRTGESRSPAPSRRVPRGPHQLSAATLALGLGVLFAACETRAATADGVNSMQFQDVVVPDGLRILDSEHQSYSRQEASWRQGHFVYLGATPVADAANYVRTRMPQHSWQMVADQATDEGVVKLGFVRGAYVADYVFERRDGRTQMIVDYKTDYSRR